MPIINDDLITIWGTIAIVTIGSILGASIYRRLKK